MTKRKHFSPAFKLEIAKLMVDGVIQRDMPLVQTCAMIFCTGYLLLVTLADVCGILANPRLRHR